MKKVIVNVQGNYTDHGIGYTEHKGYSGTSDNKLSIKRATEYEVSRNILVNETYELWINKKLQGVYTKTSMV
jgi:hypothetical protein